MRRIVLDSPHRRNAQSAKLWRELSDVGTTLADDPTVHCIVITGHSWFSSGIDLAEFTEGGILQRIADRGRTDLSAAVGMVEELQDAFLWPTRVSVPVVAAVRGVALGAGCELALACDVRIVADDAILSLPEVQKGVVPDLGGCDRLRELIGAERALDLIVTSRSITGRDAVALGLALRHERDDKVDPAALAYAQMIAGAPNVAVRFAKRAVQALDEAASRHIAAQGTVAGLVAGTNRLPRSSQEGPVPSTAVPQPTRTEAQRTRTVTNDENVEQVR